MIELGQRARDKLTGFEGIAVARTTWLGGCVRVTLQPEKLKDDGQPAETVVFDEPFLDGLEQIMSPEGVVPSHGPRPDPARAPDSTRR